METKKSTIEALFPGIEPEEHEEARHALRRYFSFIMRLHARIAADPREYQRLAALTRKLCEPSMEQGRSFTSQIRDTQV
jgi:hypothetical protein